jgi:hypothetical protein
VAVTIVVRAATVADATTAVPVASLAKADGTKAQRPSSLRRS